MERDSHKLIRLLKQAGWYEVGQKEGLFDHYLLVSMEPVPRVVDGIRILPWSDFLDRLRGGEWL